MSILLAFVERMIGNYVFPKKQQLFLKELQGFFP